MGLRPALLTGRRAAGGRTGLFSCAARSGDDLVAVDPGRRGELRVASVPSGERVTMDLGLLSIMDLTLLSCSLACARPTNASLKTKLNPWPHVVTQACASG